MVGAGPGHVTDPAAEVAGELPGWVSLVRAPNPGPMTLEGTNTWVLRAPDAEFGVVVDPGPADEAHLAAVAAHAPIGLLLVTHGHPDHVAGAERLAELLGGPPVRTVPPDAPVTAAGLRITAVATPGHTADSVCFEVACGGQTVVLTGDTILGRGTAVVAWPDGDLGDYLASLLRLSAYDGVLALPGHGPALADCAAAARFYLSHRRARLEQVRAAVAGGVVTPAEVVRVVYADVDPALWAAAEWSVRAQLVFLTSRAAGREAGRGVDGLDKP
ncbi:MAG TPA: MBL fold metallo-hydrolase [Pilimelia sp.]|nr:MBL fold metallo-hydrolase [Pilimelia sp.]